MNPTLLEDVEKLRRKIALATEITPELTIEYELMSASLTASIEAHTHFCEALNRLSKGFAKEINELCVMKSFIAQSMKGKPCESNDDE